MTSIVVFRFWSLAALVLLVSDAVAAPPSLTHLFPAGGQRGARVVVSCTGKFSWPLKVHAPGLEIVPGAESGKLEVTVPANLPADRVWIRLYGDEGASNALPFLIGSLKEMDEVEPNNKFREAQAITDSSLTINGVLKTEDVDCFAVNLAAGQTLVAAVDANSRLGSPIDSVLQVVSPEGTVIAENHDDLNLDPRLAFTAEKAGSYIVRLFAFPSVPNSTIKFAGSTSSVYRLTLTTGPYVTHTIPLSASLEYPGPVSVAGWNIPLDTRLNVTSFGGERLNNQTELEVIDELRRGHDSKIGFAFLPDFPGSTRIRLTSQSASLASNQADQKNSMVVAPGTSVTACLKQRRQIDDYRIPLVKGQQVVIAVEARSLNVTFDPVIKLSDPAGAVVAEVDDTGPSKDAAIVYTAAVDGEFRLAVSDRYSIGGERCWYLLTVRLDEPDFDLTASADSVIATPEKPGELTVKVQRRGPAATAVGPITIQAIGLPEGVTSPAVISEATGPTATEVKLSLTAVGAAFNGPIRIVGKADVPSSIERLVRTPANLGVNFDSIWLTVTEKPK